MLRHRSVGLLVALGLTMFVGEARAQSPFGNVNDPFFLYYGFYLPRQQAQALQSGPEATLNALTAARQSYAATNRSDMFDPSGNTFNRFDGDAELFGGRGRGPTGNQPVARMGGNLNGRGVSSGTVSRYTRFGSYHPAVRPGQSRNANVAVVRGRNFGGGQGAAGVPSLVPNVGVPGPR